MSKQVKNNGAVPVSVTAIEKDGDAEVHVAALVQPGDVVEVPDDFADPDFVDAAAPAPSKAAEPAVEKE